MHLAASNEWIFFMAEASNCFLSLEQVVHSPPPGMCSDIGQSQCRRTAELLCMPLRYSSKYMSKMPVPDYAPLGLESASNPKLPRRSALSARKGIAGMCTVSVLTALLLCRSSPLQPSISQTAAYAITSYMC